VLVAVTAGKTHSPLPHLSVFSVEQGSKLKYIMFDINTDNTLSIVVLIKPLDTNLPHSVAYIALKTEAQCNYRVANAENTLVMNLFARTSLATF